MLSNPYLKYICFTAWAFFACCHATNISLAQVFDPTRFVLKNGLEIVVITDHRAPVVTHMLWYKVGSADDPPGNSGLAHFLEHLMFKGTTKYNAGEASKIIARIGGTENAFTSYDYTAFFQIIAPNHLSTVMDIEADRMRNLELTERDILSERDVVLEERRSRTDNNDVALFREQLASSMFLSYPYRIPIIGWKHEIEKLDIKAVMHFYNRWYNPNNAVLIIAGDVSPMDVKSLAQRYYGSIPKGPEVARVRIADPPHIAARRVVMKSSQIGQTRWTRRYLAPSYQYGESRHAYALQLLNEILGGSTSSRLYTKLVVERKDAVSAGSWYGADNLGPSTLGIFASPVKGKTIKELEGAIDEQIDLILTKGVSKSELSLAKKRLRRSAIFARDSVTAPARIIGNLILSGQKVHEIEYWPMKIEAVTRQDIIDAAKAVFQLNRSVTGILSPKNPT
tara:strand:- start:3186 stop:4541 length:1356 start_codon:yes stop_codon:yes gene_type:complete